MNKETAQKILRRYKKNEELNLHAENYLLLAEAFEDAHSADDARINLHFIQRNRYANEEYSKMAHSSCNHYYYELVRIANAEK